jgi:hypothetical protein
MKILAKQIMLNDVLYYTGSRYDYNHEVKKIDVKKIEINDNGNLVINSYYYLYNKDNYYQNESLYFSEKKANNVITNWIEISNKAKEKYKEQDIQRQKYEDIIKNDNLEEKYINKNIMIFRDHKWIKTSVKRIYATHNDIYLVPKLDGHICKMSREGKTWKWWSELEELEIQKKLLEEKISKLKEVDSNE